MKLGEIKIAALKLMFDVEGQDYEIGTIPYDDDNYSDHLYAMPEAIHRAIDRLMAVGAIYPKVYTMESVSPNYRYDLSELISDYYMLKNVHALDGRNLSFHMEGKNLLVFDSAVTGGVQLVYTPRPKTITGMDDTDNVDLDDELARLIPYFVKSDVLEEDDPTKAALARQRFEQGVSEYLSATQSFSRQSEIENVLGGW